MAYARKQCILQRKYNVKATVSTNLAFCAVSIQVLCQDFVFVFLLHQYAVPNLLLAELYINRFLQLPVRSKLTMGFVLCHHRAIFVLIYCKISWKKKMEGKLMKNIFFYQHIFTKSMYSYIALI